MIIKICGVKDKNTIICCERNEINYFGMIFYHKSPRNISIEVAEDIINFSKNLKIKAVGVFVNEKIDDLKLLVKKLNLKYIQLHGNEDFQYIQSIKKTGIKVIKKISIKNFKDTNEIKNFYNSDYFLFDYKPLKNELPGGNAKSFDWSILQNLKINKPWFLSGGINVENISQIKNKIKPPGIDLSSGVEKKLGIKNNQLINNLIDSLNNA